MSSAFRAEWLQAAAASHRRDKLAEAECMRTMVRILTRVIGAYRRGEVTPGLFESDTLHHR
jgi:hypothetical protein